MPGPKPSITLEVVERVSKCVGRGVPLEMALATERNPKINRKSFQKHIERTPNSRRIYEAGKADFLVEQTCRLVRSKDLHHVRWLLERRHSGLFGRADPAATFNVNASASAICAIDLNGIIERVRNHKPAGGRVGVREDARPVPVRVGQAE